MDGSTPPPVDERARLRAERWARIVDMTKAGKSLSAIASELGCARSYVAYVRKMTGAYAPRPPSRAHLVQFTLADDELAQLDQIVACRGTNRTESLRSLIMRAHAELATKTT
jgi:hypothetical protein